MKPPHCRYQKCQPKLKVFQPLLRGAVWQSPPSLDGIVPRPRLKHRGCIAIQEAKTFVLVLQVVFDIEFGVFLQRLGPMEVADSLRPLMGTFGLTKTLKNADNIPIGLRTVCHETFEMKLENFMPSHDVFEVVLEKHLSILVLILKIAASDVMTWWQAMVVHLVTRLTWSVRTQACSISPLGYIRLAMSIPLPRLTSNILKTKNLSVSSPWTWNWFCWT